MSSPETKSKKLTISTNDVGAGLKKIVVFFALSDVVADSQSAMGKISEEALQQYGNRLDLMPGFYAKVDPMDGAVRQLQVLNEYKQIDWHIVSSYSWKNPYALVEKRMWVEKHFGMLAKDRLIFAKRKDLLRGDYLVYRHESKGVKEFVGKRLRFGEGLIPHWSHIVHHFGFIAEFGSRTIDHLED
jgi:5'-nucleotidase